MVVYIISIYIISAHLSSKIIAFASSYLAATIIVPQDYPTIQTAIGAAQEGDVGIAAPGEDIDAFPLLADGRLLISTMGASSVLGAPSKR
ncbi:MAG: hypothetical protein MUO57_04360 [Anaerolineales bacterium]|nr:hypothetical protein [Anaerolineales bacterium]